MKSLGRDVAGHIQHAFKDVDPPQDNEHPVSLHMKASESLQSYIILNNKIVNGVLHLGTDNNFQIISIPSVTSDFQKGMAFLHGLLGTSASQNFPFRLNGEHLVEVIVLAESDASVPATLKPVWIEAEDDISLDVPDKYEIIKTTASNVVLLTMNQHYNQ